MQNEKCKISSEKWKMFDVSLLVTGDVVTLPVRRSKAEEDDFLN
jgi:hypothetical protein